MTARWCALLGMSLVSIVGARSAAADPAACVKAGAEAEPSGVELTGDQVRFCFDWDTGAPCYTTAIATGKLAGAPALQGDQPRLSRPHDAPKVTVADNAAEVCHPDGSKCLTVVAKSPVEQATGLNAAANQAGALLAMSSQQWVETYALPGKKRIAKFSAGPKQSNCNWLDWADDTLVVSERDCGKPAGPAWLSNKGGKRIAPVGGAKPPEISSLARVRGSLWAFAAFGGDAIVEQDVKTGAVAKTISVGPATEGATAWMVGDAAHLVLVYGGSRAGDVAVVDLATDKISSYPAKRCK